MKKITPEADALIQLTPAEEIEYAECLEFDVDFYGYPKTLRSEFLFSEVDAIADELAPLKQEEICKRMGEDAGTDWINNNLAEFWAQVYHHPKVDAIIDRIGPNVFQWLAHEQKANCDRNYARALGIPTDFLGNVPKEMVN